MKALMPAQAVTPTNIGQSRQPPPPPALGIARGRRRGVKRLESTALRLEQRDQIQKALHQRVHMPAQQAVELAAGRHGRKCPTQMALRIAIKTALTAKRPPLAKNRQRQHLTARQRGGWTGASGWG